MRPQLASALGLIAAAVSLWPLWIGLSSIDDGDYLGAVLALAFAWLSARSALELLALVEGERARQRGDP